jgi:hypothetical protein
MPEYAPNNEINWERISQTVSSLRFIDCGESCPNDLPLDYSQDVAYIDRAINRAQDTTRCAVCCSRISTPVYWRDLVLCETCANRYLSNCDICGEIEFNISTIRGKNKNIRLCDRCRGILRNNNTIESCCHCGNEFFYPLNRHNDYRYCDNCKDKVFCKCNECGEKVFYQDLKSVYWLDEENQWRDKYFCSVCYAKAIKCDFCHNLVKSKRQLKPFLDSMICKVCFENNKKVHDYTFKPKPYFIGKREGQYKLPVPYFGFELEVEAEDCDIDELVHHLPDYVYAKYDSSLNCGFEVVSHPFTWEWWCKNKNYFLDIWEYLSSEGCESYNTNTCGMHVHISKDAFDTMQLQRLLNFIYRGDTNFIQKISQRKSSCLREWASLETDDYDMDLKIKKKTGGFRHCALNLCAPTTVELRIFRGTLNPNSFCKNLEFSKALFDFTKQRTLPEMTVENFAEFVKKNKFRNLKNFMEDKCNVYGYSKASG